MAKTKTTWSQADRQLREIHRQTGRQPDEYVNKCLQRSLNPTQVMNIEEFVLSWSTQTLRRGPKFIRDSFTSVDSRSRVCGNGLGDVSGHVPSWLTSCFSGSTPSAFSFSDNMNVYQKSHRQPHAAFVYT